MVLTPTVTCEREDSDEQIETKVTFTDIGLLLQQQQLMELKELMETQHQQQQHMQELMETQHQQQQQQMQELMEMLQQQHHQLYGRYMVDLVKAKFSEP